MDVLLLNPPAGRKISHKRLYSCTPLGLAYLASSLENNGFEVDILDAEALNLNFEDTLKIINKKSPKIIGITSTSLQIKSVIEFAHMVKQKTNSLLIIGGVHATLDPYSLKKYKIFDYIFTGEGEITFPIIIKKILRGGKIKETIIRGLLPENLDELPIPSHHLLPLKKYFLPVTNKIPSYMETSRGCPFNCSFCSIPRRKLRFRSVDKVIEELNYLKNLGVGFVEFADENFTLNKKNVYKLCDEIIKNKIDLEWGCQTRCDLVNKNILFKMHKAGCKIISFGIESGSLRVRKSIMKPITNHQIFKAFRICSKIGIKTGALFILGLPSETKKEMLLTIKFAKKLNPDYCQFSPLFLYPNTNVFYKAIKEKKIDKNAWDKFINGDRVPIYVPDTLTYEKLENIIENSNRNFYFRSNYILKNFVSVKSLQDLTKFLYYTFLLL
jgi:radical SAM superfamily enzyme YgiQ (UPF0313 family)